MILSVGKLISADEYRNRLNQNSRASLNMLDHWVWLSVQINLHLVRGDSLRQKRLNSLLHNLLLINLRQLKCQKTFQTFRIFTIKLIQFQKYQRLRKLMRGLPLRRKIPLLLLLVNLLPLETQAAQALGVYKDIRDKYATIAMKEAETKVQQPLAIQQKAAEVEIPVHLKAREEAVKEAQVARNLLQQTDAMKNLMFDKDGKPVVNTGPLGQAINRMAAVGKQLGFSDDTIKSILATNPSNAQSIEKLRTTLSTEIGRQE
jgi:hypothetical protein